MRDHGRIAFSGDWHANTVWAHKMIDYARDEQADAIVHLGDFGWQFARFFVQTMAGMLRRAKLPLYFVDGNHENFDRLLAFPLQPDGLRKVADNLFHLPRGHRFTWGGVRFLACGGAVSVDRHRRVEGRSWWPQETITCADIAACEQGGPADVLLAHDCPAGVEIPYLHKTRHFFPEHLIGESEAHRTRLLAVAAATTPGLILHGHYDRRYTTRADLGWGPVTVHGLDKDESTRQDNMLVLDIAQIAALAGLD